jgi:hypothetical protein
LISVIGVFAPWVGVRGYETNIHILRERARSNKTIAKSKGI